MEYQDYYKVLGALLYRFEATIEHFAGDGLMAFFNDPIPCPDPEARAVRMAVMSMAMGTTAGTQETVQRTEPSPGKGEAAK